MATAAMPRQMTATTASMFADATALATLSQLIDQQAVLVASANMLAVVAVICLGIAAVAIWQRALR